MKTIPSNTRRSRRVDLLKSALPLFSERGLRATTTRELAEAAGVSEPILYVHFQTKRDLFRSATVLASVARRVVLERSLSPGQSINEVVATVRDVYESDSRGVRLASWGLLEDREWTLRLFRREEYAVARHLKSAGAANATQIARFCLAAVFYGELARL